MPKKRDSRNSSINQNTSESLSLLDDETMSALQVEEEVEGEAAEEANQEQSAPQEADPSPTLEEWSRLYTAAVQFRDLAPWTWMYEDQLFAVVNPEDEETGYCSIMGSGGEFAAISVYRGEEGLASYEHLHSESYHDTQSPASLGHRDAALSQKSLMVSFEGRDAVDKRDREVFKSLGLRFRGQQAWPVVRSYEPGCVPWFISARECRFLACALEQAVVVANRVKQSPELLDSHPGCILARRNVSADSTTADQSQKKTKDAGTWEDQWPAWPYIEEDLYDETDVPEVDEIRLQRAVRSADPAGAWEVDIAYAPFSVEEGERPYFPLMMMLVDYGSGMVLNMYPAERGAPRETFVDKFIETIEMHHIYPEQIAVSRNSVGQLFQPVANITGSDLLMAEFLPGVEQAWEGMIQYMG